MITQGPSTPGRTFIQVIIGVAASILIFGAVPFVLGRLVGIPVPPHWNTGSLISANSLVDIFAVVAWVAWAACCHDLLRCVVVRVRQRNVTTDTATRLSDRVAARIATAVLVMASLALMTASLTSAIHHGAIRPRVASTGSPIKTALEVDPIPPIGQEEAEAPLGYQVMPGDTLWMIAERLYGDGSDWPMIAALNEGRPMSDGGRFLNPDLIQPGWTLLVPSPTLPQVNQIALTSSREPADHSTGSQNRTPRSADRQQPRHRPAGKSPLFPSDLPELGALGIGALGAAVAARRMSRRRRAQRWLRASGTVPSLASDAVADVACLVQRFEGLPVLDVLSISMRYLTASIADELSPPTFRVIRVGSDGVDLWLTQPTSWTPNRWERAQGGEVWHLPQEACEAAEPIARQQPPWIPALLPIGDDEDGTWLIPVQSGTCVAVAGAAADELVTAMIVIAKGWDWSDDLISITSDARSAMRQLRRRGQIGDQGRFRQVVFVGDPGQLDADSRSRCGIITTRDVAASTDLVIVVDQRAATIHPIGRTVRPYRLAGETAVTLSVVMQSSPEEHFEAQQHLIETGYGSSHEVASWVHKETPTLIPKESSSGLRTRKLRNQGRRPLGPGAVEVRLLTPIPRIDGLTSALPPNQARRSVELVAYLALHHPDPVTSDRLRTRVLGSSEADAAAKTLFNTAGAARKAMGTDLTGKRYLPRATKSGHYRIADEVTVDVLRATALASAAAEADGLDEEMALLRAALDLVEGEPLGGLLAGYGWWRAEGHESRIAAVIVDAACRLAALGIETDRFELARWALDRARLVDPFSEALVEAALKTAAAAGDGDRLRREWNDCQRRTDEMGSDFAPTVRVRRLYAELSERLPPVVSIPVDVQKCAKNQASFAAMDDAPRSTVPSAPAVE